MVSDARFLSLLKHNKEIIYPTKEQEIRGVLSGLSKEYAYLTLPDKPGSIFCIDLEKEGKKSLVDGNNEFKVGDEVAIVQHSVLGGMMSASNYDFIKKESTKVNLTISSYLDKYLEAVKEKQNKITEPEIIHSSEKGR